MKSADYARGAYEARGSQWPSFLSRGRSRGDTELCKPPGPRCRQVTECGNMSSPALHLGLALLLGPVGIHIDLLLLQRGFSRSLVFEWPQAC